jgi:hypothetical protein
MGGSTAVKRALLWINLVAACVIVVGVFVQVYLITAYVMDAGDGALDAHGIVGGLVIHLSELIVFLTAIGAFWKRWGWIGFNFFLFVLGTAQIFLLPPDEDPASGWVHGLHGLFALFVLVMAAVIAHRDLRELGLRRPAGAAESA